MSNENFNLLVVDDNLMERMKLSRAVQAQGYTVDAAGDGKQALEKLRAQRFDLVLLDIVMPEMDGYQVLQAMQGDNDLREIPVVMVSGFDDMESVQRCKDLGASAHLPKSFDTDMLTGVLSSLLSDGDSSR